MTYKVADRSHVSHSLFPMVPPVLALMAKQSSTLAALPRAEVGAYWVLSFGSHLYSFYQLHIFSKGKCICLKLKRSINWVIVYIFFHTELVKSAVCKIPDFPPFVALY